MAVAEVSLSGLTPTAKLLLPSVASLKTLGESVSLNTEALTVGNNHNERLSFGWKQKDSALYVYFYISGTAVARLKADFPNP